MAISDLCLLLRLVKTLIIAFSSVPKPFIAFLNISASVRGSNGKTGTTVGTGFSY